MSLSVPYARDLAEARAQALARDSPVPWLQGCHHGVPASVFLPQTAGV